MNLLPVILGLIIIWFFLTPVYQYLRDETDKKYFALFIKAVTTGMSFLFALIGLLLFKQNPDSTLEPLFNSNWLIIAIGICLIGDIIFNLNFVAGGFIFFAGHVCFILYFVHLNEFPAMAIPIITIIGVAALLYYYPYVAPLEQLSLIIAGYGLTILITLALSVMLPFTLGIYGICFMLGSIMIVASDFLLVRNRFVIETAFTNTAALYLYFTGQFVMALGLYLPAVKVF